MKKLLIFDYDGVIVDSLDVLWQCFDRVNKKYNIFPFKNKDELTSLWDENEFMSVTKIGISAVDRDKFYKEWIDLLIENNDMMKTFDGFKSILKKLSQDNCLIIISSNDVEVIIDFLKKNDLFDYFDSILGMESGRSKKEKLKIVLNEFKFTKDMTYFITDTIGDLKEVKDFGIKMVAVTWGFHDKDKLQKENPDFLIDSPKELLNL